MIEWVTAGLGDTEFDFAGRLVADAALAGAPNREANGAIRITIEALTLQSDD